ncbi:MAG: YIP1 family protein [Ignavibacteriae bacterium]|nr:MAG: YIP1 family protein [Ignavibacteriota bacterium]
MDNNNDNDLNQQNPPVEQPFEPEDVKEDLPVSDAMTGVITEPGDTFEEVKASSKRNYWLLPTIILLVLSLFASYMVTHDEELYSEIRTKQVNAAKERLEAAVKDGKMSREQMNEQMEGMEKMMNPKSPLFIIFAGVGAIFSIIAFLFLRSLIFWGVLKGFKGTATYMLTVCVLGLASIIEALQTIINTVLAIITGNIRANVGLGMIVTPEMAENSLFKILSHLDLFTMWYLIVLGIGLAKVSDLKSSKTMPVVFGLWLVWIALTSFLNLGFFGM